MSEERDLKDKFQYVHEGGLTVGLLLWNRRHQTSYHSYTSYRAERAKLQYWDRLRCLHVICRNPTSLS